MTNPTDKPKQHGKIIIVGDVDIEYEGEIHRIHRSALVVFPDKDSLKATLADGECRISIGPADGDYYTVIRKGVDHE